MARTGGSTTRWGSVFTRRAGARGKGGNGSGPDRGLGMGGDNAPVAVPPDPDAPVLVDEYEGLVLLRATAAALPGPVDVAELARSLAATELGHGTVTVVVGVDGAVPPKLWKSLGDVLDRLVENGAATVRLVLSGAGSGTAEQPSLAQQVADAWQIGVIAPGGVALIVPGGSLFVPDHTSSDRGWQLFRPGAEPAPLGQRNPAPAWQAAIGQLPADTATGCVVEQTPSGVLVRSPRARPTRPADLCYAAPVDPEHPLVLVGVPAPGGGADVPSDDLAGLLAALPAAIRSTVRLAPGNDRDLLPAAQDVADTLGIEVELLSGLPLVADAGAAPSHLDARPVLIGADGNPTWRPYAAAVACLPADDPDNAPGPGPRLLRWHSPLPTTPSPSAMPLGQAMAQGPSGLPGPGGGESAAVELAERWQVTVTRAGLSLGPTGRPRPLATRPVTADQLAVDLGAPDVMVDSTFFPVLSRLLFALEPEVREYVTLHALGRFPDGGRRLRRMAVQHGVRVLWPPVSAIPPVLPTLTSLPVGPSPVLRAAPAVMGQSGGTGPGGAEGATMPAEYRELIARIVRAVDAGDHVTAAELAVTLERRTFGEHGETADDALHARQIRAHVSRLAGDELLATDLYRDVALKLLVSRGADAPETEQAAANADACWRAVGDMALARRIAPSIITMRGRIPGPERRLLRAAERYCAQLDELLTTASTSAPAPAGGRVLAEQKARALPTRVSRIQQALSPDLLTLPNQPDLPNLPHHAEAHLAPPAAVLAGAQPGMLAGPHTGGPTEACPAAPAGAHTGVPAEAYPAAPTGVLAGPQTGAPAEGIVDPHAGAPASAHAGVFLGPHAGGPGDPHTDPFADLRLGTVQARPEPEEATPPTAVPPSRIPLIPVTPAIRPSTLSPDPANPLPPTPGMGPMHVSPEASPLDPTLTLRRSMLTPSPTPSPTPALRAPAPAPGVQPLPYTSGRRSSTEAERTAFRALAQPVWERHSAAVSRAITRMPALRGPELDAARTDLVALHMYLTLDQGPLSREDLADRLAAGDDSFASYAVCLASGLDRLPSYRGAAVRGGLAPDSGLDNLDALDPGTVLHEPGPLSALSIDAAPGASSGRYVIWSSSGRRVRSLLGAGPTSVVPDEVVFAPGTAFRLLAVRSQEVAPVVLLRELPGVVPALAGRPQPLDHLDRDILSRLDEALDRAPSAVRAVAPAWPARCTGPLGATATGTATAAATSTSTGVG